MSTVVGFAEFLRNRSASGPFSVAARQTARQTGFTPRDHEDLEDWSNADHRVSLCSSDNGAFAMLYERGRPWASWGVVREGRSVLLWDCVTLADIGSFPSMIDALAAVPIDDFPAPVRNVIRFAAVPRAEASPPSR